MEGIKLKRTYEKPLFAVERFTMAQSVAAGCGVPGGGNTLGKPGHWSKTTCGWDMGNGTIWVANSACTMPTDENANVNGVCYNTPSGNYTIFSST